MSAKAPYAFTPHKYHPIGGGWIEHIPFAFTLLEILRPKSILELGVESGGSFFAWAQGIKELGLDARLVGVDWGGYFEADFVKNEKAKYPFTELIKGSVENESSRFVNHSVDILHHDAGHGYEEVVRDLELYIPKMKYNSILLVHDTSMPEMKKGVDEIAEKYCWGSGMRGGPRTKYHFDFPHSSGLGVLCPQDRCPEALEWLFDPVKADAIKDLFASIWNSYSKPTSAAYKTNLRKEYDRIVGVK